MPGKLLVLGIDAASPALIRRWAADGKLPGIRSLIDRGVSRPVRGVRGLFIGSTWPSFYTGLNPAGHGFYRIKQLKSGTYDFYRPLESPRGMNGTAFWRRVSDAGRRVAVLDVPLSRLERDLNGLQMIEWGGHDSVFGFHASPDKVAQDVLSKVGTYPMPSKCDDRKRRGADFGKFVAGLEAAVKMKTRLTLDYLEQEHWDLFIQVFTEAHCVGHQCWHLHDPGHPSHDAQLREFLGDPLERVYREIDGAVTEITERAGDAYVLLVSAHGMGQFRGAGFLLRQILFRLGVTTRPTVESPSRLHADVSNSKCFPVPNGAPVGGIRLNLAGREPQGVLRPGAESNAFCEELSKDLRAIIDERTASPLIKDVYRTDTLYSGVRSSALPDLLVEWNGEVPTGTLAHAGGRGAKVRATSTKIGTVEGDNSNGRTGEHIPTGMFVFTGRDVPARQTMEPVSVMDFHPTICTLLGLPDPGVDGEVIRELAHLRA